MAIHFGESGCWKNVLLNLKSVQIIAESPNQIHLLLLAARKNYFLETDKAEKIFEERREQLVHLIAQHENNYEMLVSQKSLERHQETERLDQKILVKNTLILEKTKSEELNLNLQLEPLLEQLSNITQEIALLIVQKNEAEMVVKQKIAAISLENKPLKWYHFFARIKSYFFIRAQKNILKQDIVERFQPKLTDLNTQKKELLKKQNTLQKNHQQKLEKILLSIKREVDNYQIEKQTLTKAFDRFVKDQQTTLDEMRKKLIILDRDKPILIKQQIRKVSSQIEQLESILNSSDYKGAIAELEMIEHLKGLPNDHVVFSDVCLESYEYHRYNGSPLKSAQIDHLVVSPKGIFIIEVKNWSKHFADSNDYHDPCNQIERANRLCYILLNNDFKKMSIKNIIAYKNTNPIKTQKKFIKVLQLSVVTQYIMGSYFKDIYTKSQQKELVNYFKNKVNKHGY